ncbi:MAG: OFA family oxalate/formate antiporter-like MFS transporter [Candidatus Paceibacteria bacterium]|jgi:OFA family oxalate/formate antiporter-like MFS transporter
MTVLKKSSSGLAELVACILVSAVFGTVHSFSVWLGAIELFYEASRTQASMAYGIALLSLSSAVYFGSTIYRMAPPVWIGLASLVLGLFGLLIAVLGQNLIGLWLGFGLIFGFANGLGYGFALQFAAIARSNSVGFAMGLITAAYAGGAVITPAVFGMLSAKYGPAGAMFGHGSLLVIIAPAVFLLLRRTPFGFSELSQGLTNIKFRVVLRLFVAFGAGVAPALMLISQATEVMRAANATEFIATQVPAWISVLLFLGALGGGVLVDKMSARAVGALMPLGSLVSIGLVLSGDPTVVLLGLLLVGLFYGATIAVFPAFIANAFGSTVGTWVYGRVFISWGIAGLVAPIIAGAAFDKTGSYFLAFWMAGALALISVIVSVLTKDIKN